MSDQARSEGLALMATEMTGDPAKVVAALRLAAEGREQYSLCVQPADWREFLRGQAAAFRRAADLIEKGDTLALIADNVPVAMWPQEVDDYVMGRQG